MNIYQNHPKEDWSQLIRRPLFDTSLLHKNVKCVLKEVKKKGDKAIKKYTEQFDNVKLKDFYVTVKEMNESVAALPENLKNAIQLAADNIRTFHLRQIHEPEIIETMEGVQCWRKYSPIEKVGLYIPGGSAPLFSTILMLGIPAKMAGCKEIILCSPLSLRRGVGSEAILYAAKLVGITKVFKVGGAQAIAAMAYGTETIPKVNKIFGPGNQYVTYAKQLVQKDGIAIDMPAGPSEVAVFADKSCIPAFVAADLLSQAEHGADSQVILVSDSEKVIDEVQKEIEVQLEKLPRKEIARQALKNSKAILMKNKSEAMDLLNEYAPEHLILSCKDADKLATKVINAGSVFLGNYSPESAGDYASGTNHTLPTNGYAKSYSGVSLDSFIKKITFQKLSKEGLKKIGRSVELMAEAEGLIAHKNAVTLRLKKNVRLK